MVTAILFFCLAGGALHFYVAYLYHDLWRMHIINHRGRLSLKVLNSAYANSDNEIDKEKIKKCRDLYRFTIAYTGCLWLIIILLVIKGMLNN